MALKYTKEITDKLIADYEAGIPVDEIAAALETPTRSVIAKLASLGVYKKKAYVNKLGDVPIKKEKYVEALSTSLEIDYELCESLEKVTKHVLIALCKKLELDIK